MTRHLPTDHAPESPQIPLQAKLAAAWASFMFLYVYVDVIGLYKPGAVAGILKGQVWKFDITESFAVTAIASAAVPIVMILLSTILPAHINRRTNLFAASVLIPWMAFNLVGGQWLYYYGLGFALELTILAFILRSAWSWRTAPSHTSDMATAA